MSETEHDDLDTIFELLSRPRCRYTLFHFLENQHTNVENVSHQVAAWEDETTVQSVTEATMQTVTTSLIHNHLPRLAECGIIEFDNRSGDVAVTDRFDSVRDSIERARVLDDGPVANDEPIDSVLYTDPLTEPSTHSSSSE
jgi:hypothetical protein